LKAGIAAVAEMKEDEECSSEDEDGDDLPTKQAQTVMWIGGRLTSFKEPPPPEGPPPDVFTRLLGSGRVVTPEREPPSQLSGLTGKTAKLGLGRRKKRSRPLENSTFRNMTGSLLNTMESADSVMGGRTQNFLQTRASSQSSTRASTRGRLTVPC
jgi:hypothetical protein